MHEIDRAGSGVTQEGWVRNHDLDHMISVFLDTLPFRMELLFPHKFSYVLMESCENDGKYLQDNVIGKSMTDCFIYI